jgi:dipeptidyl aminopeptidase/acylaminoacyl peptidase
VDTDTVRQIGSGEEGGWIQISPDGRYIAHALRSRPELILFQSSNGIQRSIALPHQSSQGYGWSWSPRSDRLAYRYYLPQPDTDAPLLGKVVVVSVKSSNCNEIGGPDFLPSNDLYALLWGQDGEHLYIGATDRKFRDDRERILFHDERLFKADVRSLRYQEVAGFPGQAISTIVSRSGEHVVWSDDGEHTILVFAAPASGGDVKTPAAGLYRVGIGERSSRQLLAVDADRLQRGIGASGRREIYCVRTDYLHAPDIWTYDLRSGKDHPLTSEGAQLASYDVGQVESLKYSDSARRELRATILLPPGYSNSTGSVPTIVWVWGSEVGADYMKRFPLPSNNALALSSRGYAVLFPDTPQRPGAALEDDDRNVALAIDAATKAGVVDPERMAVIGYSYGAYCVLGLLTKRQQFKAAIISGVTLMPELTASYMIRLRESGGSAPIDYEGTTSSPPLAATPWSDRDRYLRNSPFYAFDKVTTPLLIGQGNTDGLEVADTVFSSLVHLGKEVEMRVYEDDHVISEPDNVVDFWNRKIEFLDQHLGISRDSMGRMRKRETSAAAVAGSE